MNRVIIIGGGVSGLTSSIYLAQANIEVIVFNKGYYGSLSESPLVCNFPGFAEGISGFELLDNMTQQAINHGVNIIEEEIVKIDFNNNSVLSENNESYTYDYLIISTGCKPRKLDVLNANKYECKGIHYCAVCDGVFYKDKEVIVVGGGNTALTEAIYLSSIAKEVNVFVRRDILKANKSLFAKASRIENIKFFMNVEIQECFGDNNLNKIIYLDKNTNEMIEKDVDAIFVSIGIDKNEELYESIDLDKYDNVYLNGDLINQNRQAVIAAGKGAEIALKIIERI